jgi:hypothetical protein
MEVPKVWLFFTYRTLRLGPDRIPLRLREPAADFLHAGRKIGAIKPS